MSTTTGRTRSFQHHVFFACGSGEATRFWFPIFAYGENWEPKKEKVQLCRRRKDELTMRPRKSYTQDLLATLHQGGTEISIVVAAIRNVSYSYLCSCLYPTECEKYVLAGHADVTRYSCEYHARDSGHRSTHRELQTPRRGSVPVRARAIQPIPTVSMWDQD